MRRLVAVMLIFVLGVSIFPEVLLAQGAAGSLGGHSRYNRPEYEVRIQNVANGQILNTLPLDQNGNFVVKGLPMPGNFLVVLFDTTRGRVVCTEGPYALTGQTAAASSKLDIEIGCGRPPAVLLLAALAGGLGLATALALQSNSN